MMRLLFFILVLATIWVLLTALFTPGNFLLGLVISSAIMAVIYFKNKKSIIKKNKAGKPVTAYFQKFIIIIILGLYFIKVSLISSFRMFRDVLVTGKDIEPSIVSLKVITSSPSELVFLSNLITLTPGNLALDFEEDKRLIYVHLLNAKHEGSFRESTLKMDKMIAKILG